jgi:hypothetical protein
VAQRLGQTQRQKIPGPAKTQQNFQKKVAQMWPSAWAKKSPAPLKTVAQPQQKQWPSPSKIFQFADPCWYIPRSLKFLVILYDSYSFSSYSKMTFIGQLETVTLSY